MDDDFILYIFKNIPNRQKLFKFLPSTLKNAKSLAVSSKCVYFNVWYDVDCKKSKGSSWIDH